MAGDESALYLPWSEDSLFDENKEASRQLREMGWAVEKEPLAAVWTVKVPLKAHVFTHLEAEVRGS